MDAGVPRSGRVVRTRAAEWMRVGTWRLNASVSTHRRRACLWNRATGIILAAVLAVGLFAPPAARATDEGGPRRPSRAEASPLPLLRSERTPVGAGAEIVTIFGAGAEGREVPLVAVLNDTLDDDDTANDRLRYVWVFTYCPPPVWRKVLASIPFLYHRFASGTPKPSGLPPAVFDLARNSESPWRRIFWYAAQSALLDPRGWLFQAGGRTYARNERDYRHLHREHGLSVLSLYREAYDDVPELEDPHFEEVYGRVVNGGFAGLFLSPGSQVQAYHLDTQATRKRVAKNWELLRQRCEQEGLWFEPLPGPPARARHAVVWVSLEDVAKSPPSRKYDSRFLNISSPWADEDLRAWDGYTKTAYLAADGRIAGQPSPGARPLRMVPLAVYGLDFPKIPALLVDFRSVLNARTRELSKRVLDDVGRYVVDVSNFGDLEYYVAKKLFSMITGKKGIDVSQPSRVRSYAQLRALLVLENALDPELKGLVRRGIERLDVNPLAADFDSERAVALAQHRALMDHARDGELARRLEADRGAEMSRLAHGRAARVFLGVARVASLGIYKHRDDAPELRNRYAVARSLERHAALLAEVASAPAPIEVSWAPERFRDALEYVAVHGAGGGDGLARTCETIFHKSGDRPTRLVALDAIHTVGGKAALAALERIADDAALETGLRAHVAKLLGRPSIAADVTVEPAAGGF